MDLQTKKLSFIQELLRVQNEEIINKLESLLNSERKKELMKEIKPMTMEELNRIVDQSEEDSKQGKLINAREIKKEIGSWT
ncbi:MAG TPA: hypothetical protein ENI57_01260 [Ignavibacteria bacterium]|nr:hypothetical protein [Ignavibacteria bacterium]